MAAASSVIRATVADGVFTFLWVFCVSTIGAATSVVTTALGEYLELHHLFYARLAVITSLIAMLVFLFNLLARAVGGASFNPTSTAAFYASGFSGDDLVSMAFRFPAQAAGAVGGAMAIMEYMPAQYKHMLGGPSLKVDPHTGALAEGVLTFIISFAVLFIVIRGPRNLFLKTWLIAMCTVTLVISGAGYTGPAMNPANAFGWAYINNSHNTWEQFYVYWMSPFIGATLAALVFRVLFPPPVKVKKA